MKRVTVLCLVLVCMLAGCGQKEALQEVMPTQETAPTLTQKATTENESEIIPIIQTVGGSATSPTLAPGEVAEDSVFQYKESKNTDCFDVDEDGLLYTITHVKEKNRSQIIKIHDLDGNCMEEHGVKIGNRKAEHLLVEENYVYVLVSETDCANVLYQIDRTTGEAKRLYDFTEFEAVYDMVLLGDTMYVLAEYANYTEKEFINYQDWYVQSKGRDYVVISLDVNEEIPELVFVPFDLPMYILKVNEDTLGIYGIAERYKYRLFAYSPEENTLQGISAFYSTGEILFRRPFQYYEDGIFMIYRDKNIYYVSQDETEHVIACMDNYFYVRKSTYWYNRKILYANGYLFYQESNYTRSCMERIKIEDIMGEIIQAE